MSQKCLSSKRLEVCYIISTHTHTHTILTSSLNIGKPQLSRGNENKVWEEKKMMKCVTGLSKDGKKRSILRPQSSINRRQSRRKYKSSSSRQRKPWGAASWPLVVLPPDLSWSPSRSLLSPCSLKLPWPLDSSGNEVLNSPVWIGRD